MVRPRLCRRLSASFRALRYSSQRRSRTSRQETNRGAASSAAATDHQFRKGCLLRHAPDAERPRCRNGQRQIPPRIGSHYGTVRCYKRHLLDEKQRTIEQSKLNLTETKSQVVLDLDNRFRKLREARAAVQVAQLSQQAEREKLQVVLEQYKQKATLLSNALNEQAVMAQANTQLQQALAAFWTARSDFEKSLGQD